MKKITRSIIYTAAMAILAAVCMCAYATVTQAPALQPKAEIECMLDRYNLLVGEADMIEARMTDISNTLDLIDTLDLKVYNDSLSAIIGDIVLINVDAEQLLVQARKNRYRLSESSLVFSSQPVTKSMRRAGYIDNRLAESTSQLNQLHSRYLALRGERDRLTNLAGSEDLLYASLDNLNVTLWEKRDEATDLLRAMLRSEADLKTVLESRALRADSLHRTLTYLAASTSAGAGSPDQAASEAHPDDQLTMAFATRQGSLPSPVNSDYVVVSRYGNYTMPGYPKAEISNNGIDIETNKGAKARAVAEGTVSVVFELSGYNNVVMVRHGDFITVYSNIDNVKVKTGDRVKASQDLGTLYSNGSDKHRTLMHFEVRKGKSTLDPLLWLQQ